MINLRSNNIYCHADFLRHVRHLLFSSSANRYKWSIGRLNRTHTWDTRNWKNDAHAFAMGIKAGTIRNLRAHIPSHRLALWRTSCACCFARAVHVHGNAWYFQCARCTTHTLNGMWRCRECHFIINWRTCLRQFASWAEAAASRSSEIIIINRKRWMPGVENRETCAWHWDTERIEVWTRRTIGKREREEKRWCLHRTTVHDWNPYVKFDIVQV